VRIIVIAIGAVIALNLLGASKFITTILGGAGVLGIAVGFAVRDSLKNYISSIMLSLRQTFRAQDHVQINQHEGIVVRLTSRATILMTLDGNHLRIPNSIVFKSIILNYSTNPERRFDFKLGVDAADDPLSAMQVGLTEINKHESVLSEPGAGASIDSVGDSSIIIKFTGWVDQSQTDFVKVRSVAIAAAKEALEKNGFTLPEPIYRLRFDEKANGLPLEVTDLLAQNDTKATPSDDENKLITPLIDVSIDEHLQQKVNIERKKDSEGDLLDKSQPTE
jgi:small conductance mechanosensitive channel